MLSRRGSEAEDISSLGVSVRPRSSVIGLLHNLEFLESGPDLSYQLEAVIRKVDNAYVCVLLADGEEAKLLSTS